jgi:HEPN domain-containing protein
MAANPLVDAYLQAAADDLDPAKRLATPPNRLAAYHLQQAAEKIIKAVLIARGVQPTAEHRLGMLVDRLPPADAWLARLRPLDRLTPFATTYRYPTPVGRLKPPPAADVIAREITTLEALLSDTRTELVDAGR